MTASPYIQLVLKKKLMIYERMKLKLLKLYNLKTYI